MKKAVLAAAVFFAGAAGVFAAPAFSAGAGGVLGGHFTRYRLEADGAVRIAADQNINQFDAGGFVFFDATFATLAVTFSAGSSSFDEPVSIDGTPVDAMSRTGHGWDAMLGFSLLGRFPFRLSERFTVFPLLGMDYQISLMQRRRQDGHGYVYDRTNPPEGIIDHPDLEGGTFNLSDWNAFFVRIGGGAEFDLTDRLFLRGDLLYGIRLMTGYERRSLELMQYLAGDPSPSLGGLSSGPSLRLGVGWRF